MEDPLRVPGARTPVVAVKVGSIMKTQNSGFSPQSASTADLQYSYLSIT